MRKMFTAVIVLMLAVFLAEAGSEQSRKKGESIRLSDDASHRSQSSRYGKPSEQKSGQGQQENASEATMNLRKLHDSEPSAYENERMGRSGQGHESAVKRQTGTEIRQSDEQRGASKVEQKWPPMERQEASPYENENHQMTLEDKAMVEKIKQMPPEQRGQAKRDYKQKQAERHGEELKNAPPEHRKEAAKEYERRQSESSR